MSFGASSSPKVFEPRIAIASGGFGEQLARARSKMTGMLRSRLPVVERAHAARKDVFIASLKIVVVTANSYFAAEN
jgi:hypothetical protein